MTASRHLTSDLGTSTQANKLQQVHGRSDCCEREVEHSHSTDPKMSSVSEATSALEDRQMDSNSVEIVIGDNETPDEAFTRPGETTYIPPTETISSTTDASSIEASMATDEEDSQNNIIDTSIQAHTPRTNDTGSVLADHRICVTSSSTDHPQSAQTPSSSPHFSRESLSTSQPSTSASLGRVEESNSNSSPLGPTNPQTNHSSATGYANNEPSPIPQTNTSTTQSTAATSLLTHDVRPDVAEPSNNSNLFNNDLQTILIHSDTTASTRNSEHTTIQNTETAEIQLTPTNLIPTELPSSSNQIPIDPHGAFSASGSVQPAATHLPPASRSQRAESQRSLDPRFGPWTMCKLSPQMYAPPPYMSAPPPYAADQRRSPAVISDLHRAAPLAFEMPPSYDTAVSGSSSSERQRRTRRQRNVSLQRSGSKCSAPKCGCWLLLIVISFAVIQIITNL